MDNQLKMLYDMLVCVPGMNENVKIDLKMTRGQVLLLAQVMEAGLKPENEAIAGLLSALSENGLGEMKKLIADCVEKAGLTGLSDKLSKFHPAGPGKQNTNA